MIENLLRVTAPISAGTKSQLIRVYALLLMGVLSAAVGCWVDMHHLHFGGMITALLGAGMFALARSTGSHKSNTNGVVLFLSGAALEGLSLSPLVHTAAVYYPQALMTAMLTSIAVFASFSVAAIFAKRREFFFLSGIIGTVGSFLFIASISNIFVRSRFILDLQVYLGLAMFVGYVLVDTQVMIERFESGQYMRGTFVRPACDLFMDLVAIFVRLLIILMRKGEKKRYSAGGSPERRYYKRNE